MIRDADTADIAAITAIYGHHVLTGTGTFALEPPGEAEMLASFETVRGMGLPYLVAETDGAIVGYAYASPFRTRPGYKFSIEDSIYLAPQAVGRGLGKALLQRLIELCAIRGLYTMIAVIGDGDNGPSIGVHRACGFTETGRLPRTGYKFGRWLDVVFMTRDLLAPTESPTGDGWSA